MSSIVVSILSIVYAFFAFIVGLFVFFRPFMTSMKYEPMYNITYYISGILLLIGCLIGIVGAIMSYPRKSTTTTESKVTPIIQTPPVTNPVTK